MNKEKRAGEEGKGREMKGEEEVPKEAGEREGKKKEDFPLPKPSFAFIISLLYSQGMVYLGLLTDPQTGKKSVNLDQAKFFIDVLQILEDKTKGNLEDQEKEYLNNALYELRMTFVNLTQ